MAAMRLQKFLARAGVASRRKCDEEIIPSGRICVNGESVSAKGVTVDPEKDVVTFDGERVFLPDGNVTIMLNKPAGFETTMSSSHSGHIVSELVPRDTYPSLVPVGRLDKDTTGLLLFTTDGELCNRLMHPSHKVDKSYIATIEGDLSERERRHLEEGVTIDGRPTAPARCEVVRRDAGNGMTVARMIIHEGRNRQVRKMFSSVGHEVIELHRDRYGDLCLGDLKEGKWRLLTDSEIEALSLPCRTPDDVE